MKNVSNGTADKGFKALESFEKYLKDLECLWKSVDKLAENFKETLEPFTDSEERLQNVREFFRDYLAEDPKSQLLEEIKTPLGKDIHKNYEFMRKTVVILA